MLTKVEGVILDHVSFIEKHGDFIEVNIIFHLEEGCESILLEIALERLSSKYERVLVMDSQEDFESYLDSTELVVGDLDERTGLHPVKVVHHYENSPEEKWAKTEPLLENLEKFDKYRFRELVEVNPITIGAKEMLLNSEVEISPYTFIRILKTLDIHWD